MRAAPSSRRSGFTLVEVLIAISLFLLLAGAVTSIMIAVLQSAASVQGNQSRHDQLTAFNELTRRKLLALSAQSQVVSYRLDVGTRSERSGLVFDQDSVAYAFDLQPQANGYYTLRMATYHTRNPALEPPPASELKALITTNDASIDWVPLIHDVQHLDWSFRALHSSQWIHDWSGLQNRPSLVELAIELAGDLQPAVFDYWIPPLVQSKAYSPPPTNAAQ